MKLYYSKGACSLAVRITIHEIGLSCTYEAVDLKTKKTETGTDFLTINPKGSVPTLVLDNGDVVTENVVIQQYLADRHQATSLLPPVNDMNRYRTLEWLNFISTDLHKSFAPLFNPNLSEHSRKEVFIPQAKKKLDLIDKHLAHNDYLMHQQFSLADGYLFVILTWLGYFNLQLADWPNLQRYFDAVKQRPAVQKSLQEEGFI